MIAIYIHKELVSIGIKIQKADGGFYLICDFSDKIKKTNEIFDSKSLCKKILNETGFAMLPGTDFGLEKKKLLSRIAFVDFDGGKILAQLDSKCKLDNDSFEHYFPKIYEGIKKLKNWTIKNK